ncbi:MAG: iron export ABC transporter permease subunit FetB [Thioalkalispiraceae bacterium]|jgi:putative ABC transport system permease protein
MTNSVIALSILDLSIAATLVVILAILTWYLRLGMSYRVLVAGTRTVVQLLLLGLVLEYLFATSHPLLIGLIAILMLAIAGREVMARQHRPFAGIWGYGLGTISMFISSFALTLFVLNIIVSPQPWYQPQYAIPLLGMMLGNTMTGVALTLDNLTQNAWQQRAIIEQRLMLGEDWHSAIRDISRRSLRTGLIPIVNAMAAAGIISIPGMMTGQVLAGSSPMDAAKYQILIMFMITAGTGFATVLSSWLGARRLFDERHRLRLERLKLARGDG